MTRLVIGRRSVLMAVIALAMAGCVGAGPPASPTVGPSTPPIGGPSATVSVGATQTPDGPAPTLAEPPTAVLAAEGGDAVAGSLGSFTWADGGSDSPWLPGAPIVVATGEPLTVTIAGALPVADWVAKRVPAGTQGGAGAVAVGEGPPPITFEAPGPGSWSIQVTVTFGDGLGSAAYYWQVTG